MCLVSDVIEEKPRDVSASEEQREIDAVSYFTSTPVLSTSIVNTLFSSLITTLKLNPVRWERLFYAGPESTVSHHWMQLEAFLIQFLFCLMAFMGSVGAIMSSHGVTPHHSIVKETHLYFEHLMIRVLSNQIIGISLVICGVDRIHLLEYQQR